MPFPRANGIVLHPTSLPGDHGIGNLGHRAYEFVDFLERAGQSVWQLLPLGPVGDSNSPYQALSSFAGNPLLISLGRLIEDKLLQKSDLADAPTFSEKVVDFDAARVYKEKKLRAAFANFQAGRGEETARDLFTAFCRDKAEWLDDFALFMALKREFAGAAWWEWTEKDLIARHPATMRSYRDELAEEVRYHQWCQYVFFEQWRALRRYANGKGVRLLGDIPIYTAHDSADVWAEPELFEIDPETGEALKMAGCPPDYFAAEGQLWGNPIYRWDVMKKNGYRWWLRRLRAVLDMTDIIRIDHFRGIEAYWEVPGGEKTAISGKWVKGPGAYFLQTVRDRLGELPIIAEDLGTITPEVTKLRRDFGFPGMKVLQFAFGDDANNPYLPHNLSRDCVIYTGTHDNDTTLGWYKAEGPDYEHMNPDAVAQERDRVRRYLARDGWDIVWDMMRLASLAVSNTSIFPMQDPLMLGSDARMNRPGAGENQWRWRMTARQLRDAPASGLRQLAELYGRLPQRTC